MGLPKMQVSELSTGDLVREKVWNTETQDTEFHFLTVLFIEPGPTSSYITLELPHGAATRIRPRNSKVIVALRGDQAWYVGNSGTGQRLRAFGTHDEAAAYIATLPDHESGVYYLDGPER